MSGVKFGVKSGAKTFGVKTSGLKAPGPAHAAVPARAAHLQPRGSSQGGLRQYNERVVLQAIRLHGALPGAEIARLTRLTAQTVSLITKRLLDDGLLRKGEPQRGKVGQPAVPLSLDPDGAFAIGVNVGRRSMDVLLVDFTGAARQRWTIAYRYADPARLVPEIAQRLKDIQRKLGAQRRERLQGMGIAAPLQMGGWRPLLGMPAKTAKAWQETDLALEVGRLCALPVTLIKDTAAATVAELVAGHGRALKSFLYIFVDTFIGGGLVLDSQLRGGQGGNAGAVGSMPLGLARADGDAPPAQLLSVASLLSLERAFAAAGLDSSAALDDRALAAPWRAHTERWLPEAGAAIALAIHQAACLLDLSDVVIDGSFSRALLHALLASTEAAMAHYSWEGVAAPRVLAGTIGSDARALGGALLPLVAQFAPDRDLFLKLGA